MKQKSTNTVIAVSVFFVVLAVALMGTTRATVIPHLGKLVGSVPPTFDLNLDLPPKQRWTQIAIAYRSQLYQALALVDWILPASFRNAIDAIALWGRYVCHYQEMVEEIEGISEAIAWPFPVIFTLNFAYEFTTVKACSSVVIRDANNTVMHGRNMDFELWNRFSALMAQVNFYKGGKYLATLDVVVGSVFALTGARPYAFSLTEDTRHPGANETSWAILAQNIFVHNYQPSAWLLRRVLLEETSYAAAKQRLLTENVTAPIYYILSGVAGNEGLVIEKKAVGVHAYYELNATNWFYVQTNYERADGDPWWDNRRTPAETRIKAIGPNITIQQFFDEVMTKWPTLNIGTILTFMSIPAIGYQNLTVWYGTNTNVNSTALPLA